MIATTQISSKPNYYFNLDGLNDLFPELVLHHVNNGKHNGALNATGDK